MIPNKIRITMPNFTGPSAFLSFACALVAGLGTAASATITTIEGAAATPAGLTPTRDAFRAAVGGGTVPGPNGDFGGLRREINWDGVPNAFADPNALPGNFFNVNSPRGAEFTTPGSGFLVSSNPGGAAPVLFGFPSDLQAFSPNRLFAPVGSNVMDVLFFVPGTSTPAFTTAFGVIFADCENADQTRIDFFSPLGTLIYTRFAIPADNQGLSFLGGVADAGEQIARVRITLPENFLIANGVRANETADFVVMDDFLYATPTAIPAPGAAALAGLVLTASLRRRR